MRYVFSAADTIAYRFPTHTNELFYGREDATATEAFIVVLEPGEVPPLHRHPDIEQVFFVIEGSGLLQIGASEASQQYRLKPGDLVRVPPDTWHCVHNDADMTMRYLSVDAFAGARPLDEPTWDSHVVAQCAANGWDFAAVRHMKGG